MELPTKGNPIGFFCNDAAALFIAMLTNCFDDNDNSDKTSIVRTYVSAMLKKAHDVRFITDMENIRHVTHHS